MFGPTLTTVLIPASAALLLAGLAQAQPRERSGAQVVAAQCIKCHESGLHGAPKIDDRAAWSQRMKYGVDATVRSAIKGHGAMPARGGIADLTDGELRAAILYMFYPAGAAALKPYAAPAAADPNHNQRRRPLSWHCAGRFGRGQPAPAERRRLLLRQPLAARRRLRRLHQGCAGRGTGG
jgi:cytochrome c5